MSDLRERGRAILTLIASIRRKRAEQEASLRELERHAALMAQGIDSLEVRQLLYDPLADVRRVCDRKMLIYTHVILKDGTKLLLDPHLPMRGDD